MLPVKSKYKIGKRLGVGVFEQLQTQKFALSEARFRNRKETRRRTGSDYGRQLLEKQRLRYTYGIAERQLSNYAKKASDTADPSLALYRALEFRADSVIYRSGLAPTRRAARQMVSHGHITVNGRRITTPSYMTHVGSLLSVREGSRRKALFASAGEEEEHKNPPQWLTVDRALLQVTVVAEPVLTEGQGIDYSTVFEFYSR